MEYTVNRLAQISGVSKRTLRYYDEIGLLRPERVNPNGYRIYGQMQVDLLQQILFYRELGLPLEEIREIIKNPGFDREKALEDHLTALLQKKRQTEILISNVKKTLDSMKGRAMMSDEEKFEGFKRDLIKENEEKYGREVRKAYGEDAVCLLYTSCMRIRQRGRTGQFWPQDAGRLREIPGASGAGKTGCEGPLRGIKCKPALLCLHAVSRGPAGGCHGRQIRCAGSS